ncbi:hypothetical protein [Arsenophonus sp. PmNCSU2021_1]|uniref:hypothetical protein n=1 Tax=Arsenophonus sp. PmNCSU2021_1 TaxID=3118989 RepID=UPI003FA59FBE
MWLYKDQGGDGVRLNNGEEKGVGDYIFHKDGGFRAPSSVYAGAARMAADGNIHGSQWGVAGRLPEKDLPAQRGLRSTEYREARGQWMVEMRGHRIDYPVGEIRKR